MTTTKPNGGYLTREAILNADDIRYMDVEVPEWGDRPIRIRQMNAHEKLLFGGAAKNEGDSAGFAAEWYPRIAAWVVVNAKGRREFKDEDMEGLGEKSHEALKTVVEAALEFSGLTEEAQTGLGKDSEPSQTSDSPTS